MTRNDVVVLGAGLTGLLIAILLAKRGIRVHVYEQNPDPRSHAGHGNRSINLALAERGRRALNRAGLLKRVMSSTTPMPGRQIHHSDGEVRFQPYGRRPDECIYSIGRDDLNDALMDGAIAAGVVVRFEHRCVAVDADRRMVVIEDTAKDRSFEVAMNPLIAADGAGSFIRRSLNEFAQFGASEQLLDHGYKELSIPPTGYGAYRMNPYALHIWPRGGHMLIALPNPGGDFTATLFLAAAGDPGFAELEKPAVLTRFVSDHYSDVPRLMPNWRREFAAHPVGIMGTVRCERWHLDGDVVLIGDAAHAIVPFHGQGMNAAFEDCYLFDSLMDSGPDSWLKLFQKFESAQRDNANAIADMALENYVEMRDTVRNPGFHLKKQLAFELETRLPDRFIPRYSMVMFHPEIAYREAFRRGAIQAAILDEYTRGCHSWAEINADAAAGAAVEQLTKV